VFFILTGFYNTAKLSVECVAVCNESPEMLVENFLITAKKSDRDLSLCLFFFMG
jgi:hypothetical protein